MKDWLNDRKNLPIIGAITGVVLVLAGVLVWFTMKGSGGGEEQYAATPPSPAGYPTAGSASTAPPMGQPPMDPSQMPPPDPSAAAPPGTPAPTASPQPAAAPAQGQKVASASLLPTRGDPFLPLNYKAPPPPPPPRLYLPPVPSIYHKRVEKPKTQTKQEEKEELGVQPMRRMAGILYNGRVYAILETGSDTFVVKPGDVIEDGRMKVDSIEPNKVVLRTLYTKRPLTIVVRMSEGNPANQDMTAPPPGGMPGGMPYSPYNPRTRPMPRGIPEPMGEVSG